MQFVQQQLAFYIINRSDFSCFAAGESEFSRENSFIFVFCQERLQQIPPRL